MTNRILERLAQRLEKILASLELNVFLDLQEEADQLCVGAFIVSSRSDGDFVVVVPLDGDTKDVAVFSFPSEIHTIRYLVGRCLGIAESRKLY